MVGVQKTISSEPKILRACDVATILHVSESTAYALIRKLNMELQKQGKITTSGKISKRYFEEKMYL